jgi:hypothetical protein
MQKETIAIFYDRQLPSDHRLGDRWVPRSSSANNPTIPSRLASTHKDPTQSVLANIQALMPQQKVAK